MNPAPAEDGRPEAPPLAKGVRAEVSALAKGVRAGVSAPAEDGRAEVPALASPSWLGPMSARAVSLRTVLAGAGMAVIAVALAGCGAGPPPAAPPPVAPPVTGPAGPSSGAGAAALVPGEVVVAEAVGPEVVAYAEASASAPERARLANPTVNGGPLVFQVTRLGDQWHEVLLPVRPNGSVGWIRADTVTLSRNPYRLEIDVSDHRLVVYQLDVAVETTTVGIGTGATPTPVGSFYLTELLAPPDPTGPYGPYAFGLSGYSETLKSFNGGDAIIGIHGTDQTASLGTDVSHGCIRVANEVITDLAAYLPLGTPVVISP